ncbi:uncharacterized protein LAESUDRAFT_669733 [Laetiporus sulphureus 93-53]|uniref:Uncharacterized protein n=1 Tax=Laetiporus sulphureus 93-53 TaxID=1314785 RepID=A0A165IM61_9APHY|nr:uncharacterized protein LAESUDRAFT_669733 [Laetiporus sulphureus 93-53]KZT13272.1 hypothetical protein LAESUDRAFT_669733 [Laetiporus sulphureus 93-53]
MLSKLPSTKFASVYESLPADVQQELVDNHLIPLLNHVEKNRSKMVLARAAELKARHTGMPTLDLRSKRIEVNALLDELHRDAKRSFVKERSQRHELLNEIVDSLTDWLNDIWSVVYEHNVNFVQAHKCLLFIAGTLEHISSGRSSCKCSFTNMYVNVTLKAKSGKRVKTFELNGAQNIDMILQFIWRDLFLSMLATNGPRHIGQIPSMLDDIEELLGWRALERVLYGGRKCPHDVDDEEDESEWESASMFESDLDDRDEGDDEDEDEYDYDEVFDDMVDGPTRARHWSSRISNQMSKLREHIQDVLMAIFKVAPSRSLYQALSIMSTTPDLMDSQLLARLHAVAASCSETFVAALDIYSYVEDSEAIIDLLDHYPHLLRPRDALTLQGAVSVLGRSAFYQQRALQIIEKELLNTARELGAALLSSFSQLDAPANQAELQQILKLRHAAPGRHDRIEEWVDAVSTPGQNTPGPMAFAAMMMGLPVPNMDAAEEADPLGYLDFDPTDPDLEDIREEFRPKLKQRIEGWTTSALLIKNGQAVLVAVVSEVNDMMPFLQARDIVDEIVGRLADRPSKHFVCDGLDALMQFVKHHRKMAPVKSSSRQRKTAAGPSAGGFTPPVLAEPSSLDDVD